MHSEQVLLTNTESVGTDICGFNMASCPRASLQVVELGAPRSEKTGNGTENSGEGGQLTGHANFKPLD